MDLDRKQQAAQLRLAVHQHGASPALAKLASVLCSGQLHVFAKHLEQRLVHGHQKLGLLPVHVESKHDPLNLSIDFAPHQDPSIFLTAFAHSQRSGTTAPARLIAGAGSSGWTRIARMPSSSAGSMSFSSPLPMTTHFSAPTTAHRIAISNTAGCGFSRAASTGWLLSTRASASASSAAASIPSIAARIRTRRPTASSLRIGQEFGHNVPPTSISATCSLPTRWGFWPGAFTRPAWWW